VEEKTKMNENLSEQTRHLAEIVSNGSQSDLISHADEFLLYFNRLSDLAKKSPKLATQIQSLSEIIYGLESNPVYILNQDRIKEQLRTFFASILK
jgi:hypothetical protein